MSVEDFVVANYKPDELWGRNENKGEEVEPCLGGSWVRSILPLADEDDSPEEIKDVNGRVDVCPQSVETSFLL